MCYVFSVTVFFQVPKIIPGSVHVLDTFEWVSLENVKNFMPEFREDRRRHLSK